jgi:ATP-binding cassette subfamily B protein
VPEPVLWTEAQRRPRIPRSPPDIAGTAFIAVQTSRRLLTGVVRGANAAYRPGYYMADRASFLMDTSARTAAPGSSEPVPDTPKAIQQPA